MARKRYPSDQRGPGRTKPFIRVHFSVSNHRRTAAAWADLQLRAMLVELWRVAGEKYANRTGGRVVLTPGDLQGITGAQGLAQCRLRLGTLMASVGYEWGTDGRVTWADVRNFAKKNGVAPDFRAESARSPADDSSTPFHSDADADADAGKIESPDSSASLQSPPTPASLPAGESVPGPKAEEPEEPELELGTRALRAVAKAIWPRCVAAAAQHGKPWTAEQPNETRLRFMTGRLRENAREPPEILVEAIHGAVAFWTKAAPKDFDVTARLVPETIYAATNFTKYLEAFREKNRMNGHKHERDPHGSEEITF